MRNNSIKKQLMVSGCFITFLLALLAAAEVTANDDLVTCRYLKATGHDIQLQINVAAPPPATIIVIQNIPAGITIKNSSPKINKLNNSKGRAKWLLKAIKPGSVLVEMSLDTPIKAGQLSGEIRYKNPATGMTVTMEIAP
ncbi:MAG: hypothetical protein OEY01_01750 [Desulfobulbaceae bacterium]|nr:hypothetical protein [Desulfobulbaceae bacterium]HIJ78016.1 hypothetical protein [Deltaproteobacteria bacterium]